MAVQGGVGLAVPHGTVVDHHIVSVAAGAPAGHRYIAAGGRIDGRAARRRKVDAAVQLVHSGDGVGAVAVLRGDAAVTAQRADKAGEAQFALLGRCRGDDGLDLSLDGLVVHLIRLDGLLGSLLGGLRLLLGQLRLGDAGGQLALLGLHLVVFGVQIGLLGLQGSLFAGQLLVIVFQFLFGGFQLVQHLGLLDRDILHHLIEGEQLVQVGDRRQHRHAAAFPQFLHGAHKGLEVVPLVFDVQFFLVDLGLLGRDLLLLLTDGVLHLGDLPGQHRDLALDHLDLLAQILLQRSGGVLPFFGVGQLLPVLGHTGLDLLQLLLQVRDTGRRHRRRYAADGGHQAQRCGQQTDRPTQPRAQPGLLGVFCPLHRKTPFVQAFWITRSDACGWRTGCPGRPPGRRPAGCC